MKILATIFLALALCACATQQATPKAQAIDPDYYDHLISVQTMPPGAIIDLNNDVAGVSPCTILVKDSYKSKWPMNGLTIQTINARWIDGSRANQTFWTGSPIPKHIAFLHPIPNQILPPIPTLSQR
jgi:hypothetical protein